MSEDSLNFETFVLSLGTATMVSLGEIENPVTKKRDKNLGAAKQNIEILDILSEKTKGNLNDMETKILQGILYETRLKYVEARKNETK